MTTTAVGPTLGQRWRTIRWVLLTLVVLTAISVVGIYLTAPRPGGRMDPTATSTDGAHALVALLRDHGVEVVEADSIDDVAKAMRPDALLLVAQTHYLVNEDALRRLADLPGDRLLVEPVSRTREALAAEVRAGDESSFGGDPGCDMREADRAGDVELGISATYEATGDATLTRCYDGALVRYSDDGRTVTVVGSSDFMTNGGLLARGNAALAMNLAGARPRVVWYAPQHVEGESDSSASLLDLIPARVTWIVLQLVLVVLLVALWKGRRIGPLAAEDLPVVVRASETIEGRGRLYRSRRARDRAADALRTAALQRTVPRLGLGVQSDPAAVVQSVAHRVGGDPAMIAHWLYGPAPETDDELTELSRQLDHLERQVALS
ncbi:MULTISPECIES: DUF4350 domain-containing protein [unclassified Mycobacterium]|uniref:DUF4350 domain-containing protein n=1 Tax=unclassified Mycobacterium TaxID=2642494 RepID=UPI0029C8B475|nr:MULTISPECIES: DUF4350 domain-containing protein [unclassified Mycobacterium]